LKEAEYMIQPRSQILTVLMRRSREKMNLFDNMETPPIAVTRLRTRYIVCVMNVHTSI